MGVSLPFCQLTSDYIHYFSLHIAKERQKKIDILVTFYYFYQKAISRPFPVQNLGLYKKATTYHLWHHMIIPLHVIDPIKIISSFQCISYWFQPVFEPVTFICHWTNKENEVVIIVWKIKLIYSDLWILQVERICKKIGYWPLS